MKLPIFSYVVSSITTLFLPKFDDPVPSIGTFTYCNGTSFTKTCITDQVGEWEWKPVGIAGPFLSAKVDIDRPAACMLCGSGTDCYTLLGYIKTENASISGEATYARSYFCAFLAEKDARKQVPLPDQFFFGM